MESEINVSASSCYMIMLNIKRKDSMTNTEPLIYHVRNRQLRFLGHILRLPEEESARRCALYIPPHGNRRPGRPRTSYLAFFQRFLGYEEGIIQVDEALYKKTR